MPVQWVSSGHGRFHLLIGSSTLRSTTARGGYENRPQCSSGLHGRLNSLPLTKLEWLLRNAVGQGRWCRCRCCNKNKTRVRRVKGTDETHENGKPTETEDRRAFRKNVEPKTEVSTNTNFKRINSTFKKKKTLFKLKTFQIMIYHQQDRNSVLVPNRKTAVLPQRQAQHRNPAGECTT